MSDLQARVAPNNRLARRLAAAMGVSWFLGVAWIVLYYVDPTLPFLSELGNWNLLVGFGLLLLGAAFALALLVTVIVRSGRRH
ncbi:cell division protein CrgA [Nonomuraea jabiensis]|uniref:Mg/Co/Ni transporter MgtE n=1 Tax=Nonomuraea jabiensis TaxID=882448 RepID=A0A7W9L921_9ACTN|nr:cell division protein CrgA [Nonomuraea jabiensis]MBB5775124.1 Mg/Co/Ni transporter MgtE [Nonomuraea jabiensis]